MMSAAGADGPTIELVIIAAVAENGVIGDGAAMPWHLRTDLRRFKALTLGRPVIMGRKTFLSIGRPLPGRTNIVVSRDPAFSAPGIVTATGIENALAAAYGDALRRGVGEVMVIGGAEIYRLLLERADRLEITHVQAAPAGEAIFPAIDPQTWCTEPGERHPAGPHDAFPVTFCRYRRRAACPAPSGSALEPPSSACE